MKVIIDKAERLWRMPQPALGSMRFTRKRLLARGVDFIDLQSLNVQLPQLRQVRDQAEQSQGCSPKSDENDQAARLKTAIVQKHQALKSARVNPETEMVLTPGIRMATAFLALSLMNRHDLVACPDPGPRHIRTAICLADAEPRPYRLGESNDYILNTPSLTEPPAPKLRIIFLNYPHDPTGATVDEFFYRDLLSSVKYENILIVADCSYVHPGDTEAAVPLHIRGAKKKVLELHSFYAAFGIDGLGFAVGHREAISILASLLQAVGFRPDPRRILMALASLDYAEEIFEERMRQLCARRTVLAGGLKSLGWRVRSGKVTPFLWARPVSKATSLAMARRMFAKAGILVAPGTDFGEQGEGWIRMALSCEETILKEAVDRISRHCRLWQRKYKPRQ